MMLMMYVQFTGHQLIADITIQTIMMMMVMDVCTVYRHYRPACCIM